MFTPVARASYRWQDSDSVSYCRWRGYTLPPASRRSATVDGATETALSCGPFVRDQLDTSLSDAGLGGILWKQRRLGNVRLMSIVTRLI